MTKLTEGARNTEGVLSEANFHRSRGKVTILSGAGIVPPLTVLGKVTASGKYVPSANASVGGEEGAEVGIAVNLYRVDATSEDVEVAVIARDAELNGNYLAFDDTVNDNTKKAAKVTQLAAVGIIARY